MRLPLLPIALAAAWLVAPAAAGYAPARSQDFSITNPVAPGDPAHRDVMRQLQAWWDVHAYYPRHASNDDEQGTVKIHLTIQPDGKIWILNLVESSGSRALDAAALVAFRGGFVHKFPDGDPPANIDLALHYVLAHRHDQPMPADFTPVSSNSPFTIMNDPVKSPILETMLKRTCTGTVVRQGSLVRPWQGRRSAAQAIFFRKPDGTPWVEFYSEGQSSISPVTVIGKMVQWVGPEEHDNRGRIFWTTWTVWPDGPNHLSGAEGSPIMNNLGAAYSTGLGGPVDLTCAAEILPAVAWNDWYAQTMVTTPGDPP
jgi:TonB family protein